MLPSRRTTTFVNRVAWATTYVQIAGLLERVRRGVYQLTEESRAVLRNPPARIDMKFLERYPSYVEWRHGSQARSDGPLLADATLDQQEATPEELIETSFRALVSALEVELLERVRKVHSSEFEALIVDVLIAMGYGGGKSEMGQVIGRGGTGVSTGSSARPLRLDVVYVQAKRYDEGNAAGPSRGSGVRRFAGRGFGDEGLFFTTSTLHCWRDGVCTAHREPHCPCRWQRAGEANG